MATTETLDELEQRLRDVRESAARLVGRSKNGSVTHPPPSQGWQTQGSNTRSTEESDGNEFEALNQLLGGLRGLVPPELNEQFTNALRELLIALRALIDWYLERFDGATEREPRVVDIPIA